jgi:hypothetical protein
MPGVSNLHTRRAEGPDNRVDIVVEEINSSGSCGMSSGGVVDVSKTDSSSWCSDDQAEVAALPADCSRNPSSS